MITHSFLTIYLRMPASGPSGNFLMVALLLRRTPRTAPNAHRGPQGSPHFTSPGTPSPNPRSTAHSTGLTHPAPHRPARTFPCVSGCLSDVSPVRRLCLKAEGPPWLSSSTGHCLSVLPGNLWWVDVGDRKCGNQPKTVHSMRCSSDV